MKDFMEIFLFTTNVDLARRAQAAGVYSLIVDWETLGKDRRQRGFDLETNKQTADDVTRLVQAVQLPVTVRINGLNPRTAEEVDRALSCGAKILMLPMAKSVEEVGTFLRIVGHRARTIIQVETPQLADDVGNLKTLDWDYAYIGLNDLMVARGGHSIWEALLDGLAQKICHSLQGRRYGFGGCTVLGGGRPIINILILHELIRLGGSIALLRRTFKNEILDRDLAVEIKALQSFLIASRQRGPKARAYDHEYLRRWIKTSIDFNSPYEISVRST